MTDLVFQIALSNTCLALLLAVAATAVTWRGRWPQLAHVLWFMVLLKLVTPPLIALPVAALAEPPTTDVALPMPVLEELATTTRPLSTDISVPTWSAAWGETQRWLPFVWMAGSIGFFGWSLYRIVRFGQLASRATTPAPARVQTMAEEVARRLGLKRCPGIRSTVANVSPLVWCCGWRVQIILPESLLAQLTTDKLRWVLAHELAHVRRRDHIVRWVEWLATVVFWWNPLVWCARRSLRIAEEICCDDLVIATFRAEPRCYANSILAAIEAIAEPVLRPPAVASAINSGGVLERRFQMMISSRVDRRASWLLRAGIVCCAVLLLPLGFVQAQDYEAVAQRLKQAVKAGELDGQQAREMLRTLKESHSDHDRDEDPKAARERYDRDNYEAVRDKNLAMLKKLKAMVDEGELSAEEARAKLSAMKWLAASKDKDIDADQHERLAEFARAAAKVKAVAAAGELSKQEAEERIALMRTRLVESEERERDNNVRRAMDRYREVERELRTSAESRDLSKQEAERRLHAMRQRLEELRRRHREEIEDRKHSWHRSEEGDHEGAHDEDEHDENREYVDWGAIKERIESAVDRELLTREEADDVYSGIKRRMERDRDREEQERESRKVDWEEIEERVESAVERGDLTREEAEQKYRAIKERMSRGQDRY